MHLSQQAFDDLRQLIHRLCGLALTEDKMYLVRHRLGPLARSIGCRSYEEFGDKLRGPGSLALQDQVVEAITTSETSFFRDGHPFEAFRQHILPDLATRAEKRLASGGPRVRLWSVACSTGQEPYSLAMLVYDFLQSDRRGGLKEADFRILATDVSAKVLAVAAAAEYTKRDLARGLGPAQVARYFTPRGPARVVRDEVRRLVEFRRANLMQSAGGMGTFDAIFCRNVLIYFDEARRRQVCERLWSQLAPGGWLVLGAAENLYGITDRFASVPLGDTLAYCRPDACP